MKTRKAGFGFITLLTLGLCTGVQAQVVKIDPFTIAEAFAGKPVMYTEVRITSEVWVDAEYYPTFSLRAIIRESDGAIVRLDVGSEPFSLYQVALPFAIYSLDEILGPQITSLVNARISINAFTQDGTWAGFDYQLYPVFSPEWPLYGTLTPAPQTFVVPGYKANQINHSFRLLSPVTYGSTVMDNRLFISIPPIYSEFEFVVQEKPSGRVIRTDSFVPFIDNFSSPIGHVSLDWDYVEAPTEEVGERHYFTGYLGGMYPAWLPAGAESYRINDVFFATDISPMPFGFEGAAMFFTDLEGGGFQIEVTSNVDVDLYRITKGGILKEIHLKQYRGISESNDVTYAVSTRKNIGQAIVVLRPRPSVLWIPSVTVGRWEKRPTLPPPAKPVKPSKK